MQYLFYLKNPLNLVLLLILGIILFLYYSVKFKMNKSENDKIRSYFNIANFGYMMSVFSKVRKGKSSTANGIINTKEIQLMQKAMDMINSVIDMFPNIDFTMVNTLILSMNLNDEIFYSKQNEITLEIMKACKIENGLYNDFINCKTIEEWLEEYIEAFYVVNIRGIYVYSKTWRYSYITRLTSKFLTDNTMEIKNIMINKEFYLRKYSIVYEDEISLYKGNILSHSNNEKNKGRKELKVLLGHIFKESVYYISVKQRSADEISNEKELYTNYLYIKDRKIRNDYNLIINFFEFKNELLTFVYTLLYRFIRIFNRKLDFNTWVLSCKCKYRKKKYKNDVIIRYLRSLAIVDVLVYDYDTFNDIGKENLSNYDRYKEYVLTFNLRDTIGNYDTHEFRIVYPILQTLSNIYDIAFNGYYKNKELMFEQVLFLFEKYLKDKIIETKKG